MENNRIGELLQRGIESHKNRQYAEAESCYREVLATSPNNADETLSKCKRDSSPSNSREDENVAGDSIPDHRIYSRPSHKKFNKVFGIGANKTGTTSLKKIFHDLGLMVAPQQEGEICGMQAYKGDFEPLIGYITQYDAFQDAPFSIKYTFAQVDALFPGSKFILTYRDPETWFASLMNFHKKIFNFPEGPTEEDIKRAHYLFPDYIHFLTKHIWAIDVDDDLSVKLDWSLLYNKDHYINEYNNRNKAIVRHFSARPDDLLLIDMTNENDTSKIVAFLGLPDELITSVPHENRT